MFSLRLATYLLVGPTLAGIFVIAVLSMNMVSAMTISVAAIVGAILGIPAALFIAKMIDEEIQKTRKGKA